ncbi:MAG: hypothetical protein ACTS10_21840 [Kiloniellales bacterium]
MGKPTPPTADDRESWRFLDVEAVYWAMEAKGYRGADALKALPELMETLKRMDRMHELMMRDVNHKQSAYQAETLREMNEASLQTQRLLSRLTRKDAPDDAAE